MLHLARESDPSWAVRAAAELDQVLIDHAHLEKKAAGNAINFLFRYPEHAELLLPLSRLAREELEHFELVLAELERRGLVLTKQAAAPYAGRLHQAIRHHEPARLLDLLLVSAIIEARSCERMRLLADRLAAENAATTVVRLYRGLLAAEARHHRLYLDLAEAVFPVAEVTERLAELTAHEAEVIRTAPLEARFHAG
ncbi:MAG: tRNA-(ms[2]io[6]A)-hydroxylase [Deltaproteobacteria bacterium]|nr:tRNA-(ms[2]io[6]A)-hydroxylase [Deltaproteobacteria bacterium]